MKKTRYTEEQIIGAIKQHEAGAKVEDICRRLSISTGTFYNWRSKYAGPEVNAVKRLRETCGGLSTTMSALTARWTTCRPLNTLEGRRNVGDLIGLVVLIQGKGHGHSLFCLASHSTSCGDWRAVCTTFSIRTCISTMSYTTI